MRIILSPVRKITKRNATGRIWKTASGDVIITRPVTLPFYKKYKDSIEERIFNKSVVKMVMDKYQRSGHMVKVGGKYVQKQKQVGGQKTMSTEKDLQSPKGNFNEDMDVVDADDDFKELTKMLQKLCPVD